MEENGRGGVVSFLPRIWEDGAEYLTSMQGQSAYVVFSFVSPWLDLLMFLDVAF